MIYVEKNGRNRVGVVLVVLIAGIFFNIYMIVKFQLADTQTPTNQSQPINIEKPTSLDNLQQIIVQNEIPDIFKNSQQIINQPITKSTQISQKTGFTQPVNGNREQLKQQEQEEENQLQQVEEQAAQPYFVDRNNLMLEELGVMVRERVRLGQPKQMERKMTVWTIQGSARSHLCSIMNGINIVTSVSIKTIKQLHSELKVGHSIILTDRLDNFAAELITTNFDSRQVNSYPVEIDSDYLFLRYFTSNCGCEKILFLSHSCMFAQEGIEQLYSITTNMRSFHVYYSQQVLSKGKQTNLSEFGSLNLTQIDESELSKHIFLFDSRYLAIITPLNFAYYAKYTIQQLIIFPILYLAQSLKRITVLPKLLHSVDSSVASFKQFTLKQPATENNSLCFVSYPSIASTYSSEELMGYLSSLKDMDLSFVNVSVVLFVPYDKQLLSEMEKIIKLLYQMKKMKSFSRIRLRVGKNRAVSSLSVYQSAYTYCPHNTTIISSRHNIRFRTQFAQDIIRSVSDDSHYYLTKFTNEDGEEVSWNKFQLKQITQIRNDAALYHKYFQPLQVFTSTLLKTNYFWNIKSLQLDFFSTQASFVIPLLEKISLRVKTIDKNLYWVKRREKGEDELKELGIVLKKNPVISHQQQLRPIPYNCLLNKAFSRRSHDRISKIIHLVELNQKVKQRQVEAIKKTNPDFDLIIWKAQNITESQFPLTYPLYARSQALAPKESTINTLIAFEALYNYGGIYFDHRVRPLKSFLPFLKYEIFFHRFDQDQSGKDKIQLKLNSMVIGFTKKNYFCKIFLNEILPITKNTETISNFIKTMNNQELFIKMGLGFDLFEDAQFRPKCMTAECNNYYQHSYAIVNYGFNG